MKTAVYSFSGGDDVFSSWRCQRFGLGWKSCLLLWSVPSRSLCLWRLPACLLWPNYGLSQQKGPRGNGPQRLNTPLPPGGLVSSRTGLQHMAGAGWRYLTSNLGDPVWRINRDLCPPGLPGPPFTSVKFTHKSKQPKRQKSR